jgi:hypothetical protein
MDPSAMFKCNMQDTVDMGYTLRRQGHQHLLVDVDYTLVAHKFPRIIEAMKAKDINCRRLPVHNINEPSNAMVDQLHIFMYAIGISADDFFQGFIIPQVVASPTTPINFSFV